MSEVAGYSFFYRLLRIWWSIYFVITIGIIGFVMGYLLVFPLFCISLLTAFLPSVSKRVRYLAEYIQCFSIRFLLRIQPWLRCDHNFQNIYGFFDQYKTRKVMFVSNHRSNLDTFLLISYIPGLRGLAKSSLFHNIFFAPMMFAAGFVPVQKGNVSGFIAGLRDVQRKLLLKNKAVLIFPETTRCQKNFTSIHKFSMAVFDAAIQTNAIVVPIYIGGTDQLMGRGDLFLNPNSPVTLKILDPIAVGGYDSAAVLCKDVWSRLQKQMEPALCN